MVSPSAVLVTEEPPAPVGFGGVISAERPDPDGHLLAVDVDGDELDPSAAPGESVPDRGRRVAAAFGFEFLEQAADEELERVDLGGHFCHDGAHETWIE
ncbi:hypothetical protein GCM10010486_44440 [Nonomuraea roseoviolacea subsp. carminata]